MCLDHNPPLKSEDEITQHVGDRYYDTAVRLINARPLADEDTWNGWYRGYDESGADSYFESHARRFLYQHPTCRLCLVSEYEERFDTGQGIQ